MKNCNIGDCSAFNAGSELYKVLDVNADGTRQVEYYLISVDYVRREIYDDCPKQILEENIPITQDAFQKVADAFQALIVAAPLLTP